MGVGCMARDKPPADRLSTLIPHYNAEATTVLDTTVTVMLKLTLFRAQYNHLHRFSRCFNRKKYYLRRGVHFSE